MPVDTAIVKKFSVDDVVPVLTSKKTISIVEAMEARLLFAENRSNGPVLSIIHCSERQSKVLAGVPFHPFVASVHFAFAEHRPLVLSPDMLWTLILQGVAQHTHINAERLRARLVNHQGRKDLKVESADIHVGSPESDWEALVGLFAQRLDEDAFIGAKELVSDFSTTGPVERLVSQICVLDVFEPYYEYIVYTVCGIPEISLEGTLSDWQKLRSKIELLEVFDFDWWLIHIRAIADEFVSAADGRVNLPFWKTIYKREDAYGASLVNGWIVKLFPYLKNYLTGKTDVRNFLLEQPEDRGISTDVLPSGFSQVPFKIVDQRSQNFAMEMVGGFAGVEQIADSGALRAKLAWAVRKDDSSSWNFEFPQAIQVKPPSDSSTYDGVFQSLLGHNRGLRWMPPEVFSFYRMCDGLELPERWRIVALKDLKVIYEPDFRTDKVDCLDKEDPSKIISLGDAYLRFFESVDGAVAAILINPFGDNERKVISPAHRIYKLDAAKNCSLVANSLSEFVKNLIAEI